MIGMDWVLAFLPAALRFLSGADPYAAPLYSGFWYANPPWLLPLLVPFALLPAQWGAYGMGLVAFTGLGALAFRLHKPWLILLVGLSFVFVSVVVDSNVDGFVLWGLALGGPVGLFLLSTKPQVASLVALVWLWQAWQTGRWRGVLKLTGPTLLIAAVFTVWFPHWPLALVTAHARADSGNANLWPWLVAPALGLLAWALRRKRESPAALASAWTAPYLLVHSYVGALALVAADYPWMGAALVVLSWVYFFVAHPGRP